MSLASYVHFYLMLLLRYSAIAGIAFLIFYILFRKKFERIRIQKHFPKRNDYAREILFSFSTLIIFALYAISLWSPFIKQHGRIYHDINEYGWAYFIISIFITLLIHDTYFYWTHRLMHHPKLFKLFHLTHHRSINPSPWAAYAFNPLEAIVEGGIIWVLVFTIPLHPFAIASFMAIQLTYNVYGHLGYEIYPYWLVNSSLGKWLNTSTNHNMHHKYFHDNYGLYFRFWDSAMKTTNPHYEKTINEIVSKRKP